MRMADYLREKQTMALQVPAADWQTAVAAATELLRLAGAVEARYYDAILRNVAEHGPYFVVVPGVALPHARPEDGVRQTGFSLVTLAQPVRFGHDVHDPVSVVLGIAAIDKQALNEDVIIQVMRLLDWDQAVPRLQAARSADDIQQLFADLPEAI